MEKLYVRTRIQNEFLQNENIKSDLIIAQNNEDKLLFFAQIYDGNEYVGMEEFESIMEALKYLHEQNEKLLMEKLKRKVRDGKYAKNALETIDKDGGFRL